MSGEDVRRKKLGETQGKNVVSQALIKRYNESIRLRFQNEEIEARYCNGEELRGRSSSVFAFAVLFLINITFCYLEYRAFSIDSSSVPMYGYLLSALLALANASVSQFCKDPYALKARLIGNVALSMACVIVAANLQKYGLHHALEMSLLLVWLGSLNSIRFLITSVANILFIFIFQSALYMSDVSGFRITLAFIFLLTAALLGAYLAYLLERQRRTLFLQSDINKNMNSRQESWAFTLIDIDTALSGITDFKELINLLKQYLEPVIDFESYVLTSLEGQGPKPVADKMEGKLFEDEDKTIWSQDLLNKITQSRQPTISSEHETVKGFLGIERQKFTSYRLDVPVFNDSKLMGLISLRRAEYAFDDLDMIAGLSIATQAMLIYRRSIRSSAMVLDNSVPDPVIRKSRLPEPPREDTLKTESKTLAEKISTDLTTDIQITDGSDPTAFNEVMAPSDVVKKIREDEESTKKTITLLSRENADKVAVDKYRSAAVESEPLSILIIEVDGLSKLREQDGDQVAYKVFAAIVKFIFSKVDKEKDILGRYGQNGLSVLMPKVDMNAAEKFAESIRHFVSRARYKTAYGEKSATLSIGVAAITDDTGDYGSMVKRADMALFVAKKNGRNCVKVRL